MPVTRLESISGIIATYFSILSRTLVSIHPYLAFLLTSSVIFSSAPVQIASAIIESPSVSLYAFMIYPILFEDCLPLEVTVFP